jgi:hypothetical protein
LHRPAGVSTIKISRADGLSADRAEFIGRDSRQTSPSTNFMKLTLALDDAGVRLRSLGTTF